MTWREKIDLYVKENIYDPTRITSEECSRLGLPFIDRDKIYNTSAFSQAADHFYKHNKYTLHAPNSKAEIDYWRQERNRKRKGVWLGQIRVTGYHYFFLNYYRMKMVKDGEEIDGFPSFWKTHFWLFHLLEFADIEKQNLVLIKLRGCGLSEIVSSIGCADFLIPHKDSSGNDVFWNNAYFAADDRYIGGDDQLWSKMTKAVEFVNNNANGAIFNRPGYSMDNTNYHWVAGYRNKENIGIQTGGEIKATVLKKADQARGGRKRRAFWEECNRLGTRVLCYDGQLRKVEDIKVGDKLMGVDSQPREVLKTTRNKGKLLSCYTNTKNKKQSKPFMYVTPNHRLWVRKYKKGTNHNYDIAISAEHYMSLSKSELGLLYGIKSGLIEFPYKETSLDPYYLGAWLGGKNSSPVLVGLNHYNLINNKHIPEDFKINSEEVRLQVLAGLIDADGSLIKCAPTNKHKTEHFHIQQVRENIIDDAKFIADSLGFFTYKYEYKPNKSGNIYYTLVIKGDLSRIPTKVKRNQAKKAEEKTLFKFTVKDEGIEDEYVGLTLDGDQLYITDDFVVTHNSGANPFLGKALSVAEGTTRRATVKTGIQVIWGTSNEDSRGIDAFKKVLQNPSAYDCLVFENVWTRVKEGKEFLDMIPWNPFDYLLEPGSNGVGYFIPSYEIKYMDKNGNPDIYKGYDEIMEERQKKLRNVSSEDEDVLQFFADYPLYMEEALMTSKGKRFSSDELSRQVVNVETKLVVPKIETGYLDYIREGNQVIGVKWSPSSRGKIKLLEHPKWATQEEDGTRISLIKNHTTNKLYIAGIDSIDQGIEDSSGEGSDLACLVKKRRTNDNALSDPFANAYIALYKERPEKVRTAYDNVLKMLIYFNATALLEYTKFNIKSHIVDIMKFGQYLAYEPAAPGAEIKNYKRNAKRQGMKVPKDVVHFYLGRIESYIEDYWDKILFPELLRELVNYEVQNKTKFDLVAAMGMCEILSTELMSVLPIDLNQKKEDVSLGQSKWYQDPVTRQWKFGVRENLFNFRSKDNRDILFYDRDNKPVYND